MRPDIVRGDGVIGRQVLGALAGGDDLEPAGARPIDQLAGQRRLVAIGQRIDDALRPRLLGQQRPGQHIGLDIDHDDVLAGGDRGPGMDDAGRRAAGRLDDHLDIGIGAGLGARRDEPGAGDARRIPADRAAGVARPLGVEIGDHRDLDARHGRHLVEEHRAELAGADQPDPDRPSGRGALAAPGDRGSSSYSAAARWWARA